MFAVAALALVLPALAGDPCPIEVRLSEYTPEWRDRSADLGALQSKRTWLGISYRGRGGGVVVTAVGTNGPADQAGLQIGDRVRAVGSVTVDSVATLNAALDALPGDAPTVVRFERDGQTRSGELRRGVADPVVMAMIDSTATTDCRTGRLFALSAAQRSALATGAFDDHRGFQCSTAHKALAAHFQSGDVVVVRGGRRLLITAPGWGTVCVGVGELDGPQLTPESAGRLLEKVVAAHVQDRHDNP